MKRVSRACQQCRSKHIKCNGRSPCSRCIAHAELHNITPTEICLYPEPKKRGRPSAGGSSAHHHHSSSSSSVSKKKANSIMNKGRHATSSSVSSNISPRSQVIQPQQRLQKNSSIAATIDPVICMNGIEAIQLPYVLSQQTQQMSLHHPQQMPISIADFWANQLNFSNHANELGYIVQQQPRVFTLNTTNSTNTNSTPNNLFDNYQKPLGTTSLNVINRDTLNLSNYINSRYRSNSGSSCNSNSNSNINNNNNNICNSKSYNMNSIAPQIILTNGNNFIDTLYSNNNTNEGNFSDSSDSPYSSLTSTPEMLPCWNGTPPSVANSPILPPSITSEYPPTSTYFYSINNNNNNTSYCSGMLNGFGDILHDNTLASYQQDSEDSPLLSAAKSEIAYVSSVAPFTTSTSIYPTMFDRNSTYIKTEDKLYDSQPVNTAGWLY